MDARNLFFPELTIEMFVTDKHNPETRTEGGIIWIKATGEDGKKVWIRADQFMSEQKANEKLFEQMTWRLFSLASKLGYSKAETRRRLIKAGLISK